MRLPRTPLLSRLAGPDGPPVVLLEAPPGYGKSWLARRAAGPDVLRLRGELGAARRGRLGRRDGPPRRRPPAVPRSTSPASPSASRTPSGGARLIVAGRVLADVLHEATHLVDGLIIDADALAIDPDEVAAELPGASMTLARRIVEAADGCVRVIATSLDQSRRDPAPTPSPWRRAWSAWPARRHCSTSRRASTPSSPCSPGRRASTRTCSTSSPATASSTARSPPACRCAVSSPAPSTSPAASAFRAALDRSGDRRCPGRRAARTGPGAGGRRPAARRRRRRAGDGDGADAERVDHRHRRAAPDAQPAGAPRTDRRTRAGAAAAARVGHPIARPGRRGGRRHRPGRDDGHVGADRRCGGG